MNIEQMRSFSRAEGAKKLLHDPQEALIRVDPIVGVPGVAYDASVVRNPHFDALGGWRQTTADVLTGAYDRTQKRNPQYLERIMSGREIPDEKAAATVLEPWELSGDMALKYAIMQSVFASTLIAHPSVYPSEIRNNPDQWLQASEMFGGLKSVLMITDYAAYKGMNYGERADLNKQHAEHINALNALSPDASVHYYTAPDMNSHPEDMAQIAEHTDYVLCQPPPVGTGDPSPTTALGVAYGIRGLVTALEIPEEQRGFAIQGAAGEVGSELVRLLRADHPNARLALTDRLDLGDKREKVRRLAKEYDAKVVQPQEIFTAGNISVPCAIGGQYGEQMLDTLRDAGVRAVAGAANYLHPAGEGDSAELYWENGVTVVPAELGNKGGIQSILPQFIKMATGQRPPQEVAYRSVADTEPAVVDLLTEANNRTVSPHRVFEETVYDRLGAAFERRGLLSVTR